MLFEIRNSVPEVSAPWVEVRDLLLEGRSRQAWKLAQQHRKDQNSPIPRLACAADYILNVEIARACSANRTYMALVRRAFRDFPKDPIVQLYRARVLLTRNRHLTGIEFLLSREETLGKTHRAFWGTELANVYGNAGFEASCRTWLGEIQGEPGTDSPLALYTQSCAYEGLQQWDEAIDFAQRCVDSAPNWSRARGYLASCLLARGRIAEAEQELSEAERRGHEESTVDIAAAMLTLSLHRFEEARSRLESLLTNWSQADFGPWVRRTLCILLVEMGENARAHDVAKGEEKQLALPEIPETSSGRHSFIPLPLVAQNKNQCVPTSVAMAAWPQGRELDADALFGEMHGRDGTALWRMRQWVKQHGFHFVPIRLEKEAVSRLLDLGVPLIGALEGPFNSHVDVICGHREDLDVLYVRDPGHWGLAAWPWELALQRYEMHNGVMAIIDGQRDDVRQVAEQWRSDECAALMDLAEASSKGEIADAEAASGRIADDSPAACLRDGYSVNVVISPKQFEERMKRIAGDADANIGARFRALMVLGSNEVEEVLDQLLSTVDSARYGVGMRRYLQLQKLMSEGQWNRARSLINQLLLTGGGVSNFWELNSDILAELGEHAASRIALDHAIELEPLRMSLREKALSRATNRLTQTEYLEEFDRLLAEDPENKRLLIGRADVLLDGPDGREYESAVREALRWFPRVPGCYWDLATWYQIQGRDDRAKEVMDLAESMLPDIFGSESGDSDGNSPDHSNAEGTDKPVEELPEDKDALLDIVWDHQHALRTQALSALLEIQEAGQLHWYQRARLLACRLLLPDSNESATIEAESLLPVPVPAGALYWFAKAVCDPLTEAEPSIRVALAVNDWLDQVVSDVRNYPELWFERVLLLEHGQQMERALEELRQLLERYPASSSALYRMGVVKFRQDDYPAAQEYLERALNVNPGLMGAMDVLRRVHEILDEQQAMLKCTRMLRKKFPYSIPYLGDEVLAIAELGSSPGEQPGSGLSDALAMLDSASENFPKRRLDVLRARVHLVAERIDEAARMLADVEVTDDDDEDLFEEYLQSEMSIALRRDDSNQVLSICERGLRRWPDSTRLKEIQAEHLAESDPQRSRELLREVLNGGEPQPQTAWQFLCMSEDPPDSAARDLIGGADSDRQEALAGLFSEVMAHPNLLSWNGPFLEWALTQFPDSDLLRWRLTSHYNVNGQANKSIQLAEQLRERNPDNPEALRMLGRCLIEVDPNKALTHLEQVCLQNRSADYLFDLARCHHVVGNVDKSKDLHWEILEHNPYQSCSWANLYILGASPDRLWPLLPPMLDRGCGVDDEYFLVAAVLVAVEQKQRLPVTWIPLALERWEIMKTHPGFGDERQRLLRSLLAWRRKRPAEVDGDVPSSFVQSLIARFRWPGCGWIPT